MIVQDKDDKDYKDVLVCLCQGVILNGICNTWGGSYVAYDGTI